MSAPLLQASGQALASDSKSVKLHTFDVPPGVETLAFSFDYSPRVARDLAHNAKLLEAALEKHSKTRRDPTSQQKALEAGRQEASPLFRTLNNLMNAVLIDPEGRWRGRWDRNPASEQEALLLSKEGSSKGFLPGEITPGRWTVAVECHGIFGDPCNYEVKVETRGPLTPAERGVLSDISGPGERKVKPRRGPGRYFGELHSHTLHSDGKHDLYDLARRGAELGIDFICLTDHNTTSGLLDTEGLPLTIVPGCELTTFHGHHPIYGLYDIVPWHENGRVLSMNELAPRIRAKGGVVSVAHPHKMGDPICTGCRMPDGLDPASFDMFEVWYRRWDAPESDNDASYALWNDYWRRGRRVTAVAARDWHGPSQEGPFPGPMAFTGVKAKDDSPMGIVEGFKTGNVIMSGGPLMDFRISDANGEAEIGGTLKTGGKTQLKLTIEKLEGEGELRLFRNGERMKDQQLPGDGTYTFDGLSDGPGWYRAEIWRGPHPRVMSNHIVVEKA